MASSKTQDVCSKNLSIVVSYCSNERAFLDAQVRELGKVQSALDAAGRRCTLIYSMGSHLFNMVPDATAVKDVKMVATACNCQVQTVSYDVHDDVRTVPRKYHNMARAEAVKLLESLSLRDTWVLFLDADEIPDGALFAQWFLANSVHLRETMAYKLACHWYFLKPTWRAREEEDSIVLIHHGRLSREALTDERERDGLVRHCPGGCMRRLMSSQGVMFHHYSWVRSRAGLLHKVQTWGHRRDRDWIALLGSLWTMKEPPANGDFVHGYQYDLVDDIHGLGSAL